MMQLQNDHHLLTSSSVLRARDETKKSRNQIVELFDIIKRKKNQLGVRISLD